MKKDQFIKIKENIIELKGRLSERQIQSLVYGLCAFLVLLILIFVHRPMSIKLAGAEKELARLESQLDSQRSYISAIKKLKVKGSVMPQKETSYAIDEITEQGRGLELKFISIAPKELQKTDQSNLKVLPINFKIESEYKNLGQFLAYLEWFPRSTTKVQSFSIGSREEITSKLDSEVLINLYLEAEDAK